MGSMPRPGSNEDLLRSARIAAASPSVREAVRDVALTALRSRLLTADHIAAVAKTIGEGIGSVDVTPTAPVRETYRGAWQGLEEAVGQALHALEVAAREFAQGRARLTPAERERILGEIAQMENSLASGWNNRHRIPDSLQARIATVSEYLRQAVATDAPAGGEPAAHDAGKVLSFVASGVLLGLGDALRETPRP
jgi:hypothetical protein